MERIATRKRNTINIVESSKSSKTVILSKFTEISYYLNVTDPLINPLIYISLCYHEKVDDNKEFSHGNPEPPCKS